jgi:hypothetical protein
LIEPSSEEASFAKTESNQDEIKPYASRLGYVKRLLEEREPFSNSARMHVVLAPPSEEGRKHDGKVVFSDERKGSVHQSLTFDEGASQSIGAVEQRDGVELGEGMPAGFRLPNGDMTNGDGLVELSKGGAREA